MWFKELSDQQYMSTEHRKQPELWIYKFWFVWWSNVELISTHDPRLLGEFISSGKTILKRVFIWVKYRTILFQILTAEGPSQVVFFIGVIFFGSFYLINLILAIVALSYREQQVKAMEEAAVEEEQKRVINLLIDQHKLMINWNV